MSGLAGAGAADQQLLCLDHDLHPFPVGDRIDLGDVVFGAAPHIPRPPVGRHPARIGGLPDPHFVDHPSCQTRSLHTLIAALIDDGCVRLEDLRHPSVVPPKGSVSLNGSSKASRSNRVITYKFFRTFDGDGGSFQTD